MSITLSSSIITFNDGSVLGSVGTFGNIGVPGIAQCESPLFIGQTFAFAGGTYISLCVPTQFNHVLAARIA